jgi:hypothetical protein
VVCIQFVHAHYACRSAFWTDLQTKFIPFNLFKYCVPAVILHLTTKLFKITHLTLIKFGDSFLKTSSHAFTMATRMPFLHEEIYNIHVPVSHIFSYFIAITLAWLAG